VPKVSVIIPAYNAEKFLERAIRSVLAQAFDDYEIIVVDDGSTDKTAEVASSFKEVHLFHQERSRQAAARNRGIKEAQGSYIAFLDADDEWLPDKLKQQLSFMEGEKFAISFTDSYHLYNGNKVLYSSIAKPSGGEIAEELLKNSFITTNTVVAAKKLLDKFAGFSTAPEYVGHEDYELWLRMALEGVEFGYLDKPLANYYAGHESSSSSVFRMWVSLIGALEAVLPELPENLQVTARNSIALLSAQVAVQCFRGHRYHEARHYWNKMDHLSPRQRLASSLAMLLASFSRG
jgi:glycosyltransferase involved in cell wall biosynthesis